MLADFHGGAISPDGGALPHREMERPTGMVRQPAARSAAASDDSVVTPRV
jgi:hypothetical protein